MILFSLLLTLLTTLAFALLPALQSTRFDLAPMLHGGTATPDRRRSWLWQSLVAAQVAMALLLLVAAALFLRSLREAATIDAGFNAANVDVVQVDMRLGGYRGEAGIRATNDLVVRIRQIPGVTSAAVSRMVPLQGGGLGLGRLRVPGYAGPDGNDEIGADADVISPDYCRAMELPLVRGRAFTAADRQGAKDVIRAFDPNLPVVHAQTLEEATAIGLLPQKIAAWIAGGVGVVGLLLAALGLYGLVAFSVAQRTREVAVRLALGATRESVLGLVLRQSARLALIGGVVGFALAIGVGLVLQSLLIGIRPIDPISFGTAVSTLMVVLLAASWIPARRASRLDPMRALRSE